MDARGQASDGWAALALPYAASLALLLAPLPAPTSLSRSALVLLPWLACAGLPRSDARGVHGANGPRANVARDALTWAAFALPPAVVGARMDVLLGAPLQRVALTALVALATVGLLAWAGRRAAGSRPHAVSWLTLVVGVPALVGVCGAIAPDVAPDGGAAALPLAGAWAALSPLGWLWRRVGEDASAPYPWLETSLVSGSMLLLCGAALLGARPRAAGDEA